MPIEYEYSFLNFDKAKVIQYIKQNKGKYKGTFVFKVQVYECKDCYLRVRDEGYKVTITHKKKNSESQFDEENEVNIDDFDRGVQLLGAMGFQKKYYYEKIREIWECNGCEVVFDTIPGTYDLMEIECTAKNKLDKMTKSLNLVKTPDNIRGNSHLTLFGIDLNKKKGDNTFKNLKKVLLPLVTKNKKEFIKLIKYQTEKYNSIK